MNFLCGRCRSNDCSHIDERLKQQVLDRYLRERGNSMMAPHTLTGMGNTLTPTMHESDKNKRLLLLRR